MIGVVVDPAATPMVQLYVLANVNAKGEVDIAIVDAIVSSELLRTGTTLVDGPQSTRLRDQPVLPPSTVTFDVSDNEGNSLAAVAARAVPPSCDSRGDGICSVSAYLPLPADVPTTSLTVATPTAKATRQLGVTTPEVDFVKVPAEADRVAGSRTITWKAACHDGAGLRCSLWYSWNGTNWLPVATGGDQSAVVDFDTLPGSTSAMLRVVAANGGVVAEARSKPFEVPTSSTHLELLAPPAGMTVTPGAVVRLEASVYDLLTGFVADPINAVRWSSDLSGDLGGGLHRIARLLPTGTHTVSVAVKATEAPAQQCQVVVRRDTVAFRHVADAGNSKGSKTFLSNKMIDGSPSVILQVTPLVEGDASNPHPVAVGFDDRRWYIENLDGESMPTGATFAIEATQLGPTAASTELVREQNGWMLHHPLADGAADVLLLVTATCTAYGSTPVPTPFTTCYDAKTRLWLVSTAGAEAKGPVTANVEVLAAGADCFLHTANEKNIDGASTFLDHALLNDCPGKLVQSTPTAGAEPPGKPVLTGLRYDEKRGRWAVVDLTGEDMSDRAAFVVAVSPT